MRSRYPRAALLAIVCLLALAPLTKANYDPIGSGTTKLSLDKRFLSLLKERGVKLSAVAPARLRGHTVTFSVSAGEFDPTNGRGTVEHEGALLFKSAAGAIPLKALQLKTTQKHAPFSAKLGGGQLKLATARSLMVARAGFGDKVEATSLALSAKVATRLDKKLRLPGVFKEGQPLGSALTETQPLTVTVLGKGRATFVPHPAFLAKLNALFIALNPIFGVENTGAGFTLPIFGGVIAPDASSGTLETSGSLELLQLGGGQIFWRESWFDLSAHVLNAEVDVQPSPPYPGKLGRSPVAELSLAGAAVSLDPRARTVSVSGAALTLAATSASVFNQAFADGKPTFVAEEPLGTVSFVAEGQ